MTKLFIKFKMYSIVPLFLTFKQIETVNFRYFLVTLAPRINFPWFLPSWFFISCISFFDKFAIAPLYSSEDCYQSLFTPLIAVADSADWITNPSSLTSGCQTLLKPSMTTGSQNRHFVNENAAPSMAGETLRSLPTTGGVKLARRRQWQKLCMHCDWKPGIILQIMPVTADIPTL
jgi:hypothetical protein